MAAQLREYIPNYAAIVKPLTSLTGKGVVWNGAEPAQRAFEELKKGVNKELFLFKPDYDQWLQLETDASGDGMGVCFFQEIEGRKKVIAWYRKAWTQTERHKPTYYQEAMMLVRGLQWCRPTYEEVLRGC